MQRASRTKPIFRKLFIPIFLAVFAFIFLNASISKFLDIAIVNVAFRDFHPSCTKDFLFTILAISIICFYSSKFKKYVQSENITIFLLFTSFCYAYYRFWNPKWGIYSLHSINQVKYLDLIIIATTGNVALWLKNNLHRRITETYGRANLLFDDSPIVEIEQDELGYKKYAKTLADKIESCTFQKSFAIGINGSWGIGKTSFINLIKANLNAENKIFIEFNPWASQNPKSIIKDFFDELQEGIRPYHSSLARKMVKYSDRLVKINDGTLSKTAHATINAIAGTDSVNQIYYEINEALQTLNLKLIITIDDLDRLDSKEIVEVLKLVRNTANFRNTFFIVAYDRNYLLSGIKRHNSHMPFSFLEKIFQIEITLPYFDRIILREKLLNRIKPFIKEQFHKETTY